MSDLMDKVKSGIAGIGKKTGQTYEIGKYKLEINKHESTIEKEIQKMGETVLDQSKQGEQRVDLKQAPFDKHLKEIRYHEEKIEELNAKIGAVRESE